MNYLAFVDDFFSDAAAFFVDARLERDGVVRHKGRYWTIAADYADDD